MEDWYRIIRRRHWLGYCDDIGRTVSLICDGQKFTGRIVDVAPEKGLLLQIEQGPVKVFDAAITTVERQYPV